MSDEAGARLQIERDPPKQAELKAVATSQSSTAAVRLPAHDANLDIPRNLDPGSIAALQRYAGNAAVAQLLRPRTAGAPVRLQRAAPPAVAAAPTRGAAASAHAPKKPAAPQPCLRMPGVLSRPSSHTLFPCSPRRKWARFNEF